MFLFEQYYSYQSVLDSMTEFKPFPKWGEPNTLTEEQKKALIADGEAYLGYEWPVAKAMDYMQYIKGGTRVPYEMTNYRFRRNTFTALMMAEYAEGKGRFIPDIINGLWAIMDEATWVVPAHNALTYGYNRDDANKELPDFDREIIIDLFSAGTAAMLSCAYYLFKEPMDAISPLVCRRFEKVIEERILTPFENNLYWWSGLLNRSTNNWCPWIISNILFIFGAVVPCEKRRAMCVSRSMRQLDAWLNIYHIDGGCDEGPSYWGAAGAAMFDCIEELALLSGGKLNCIYDELLIKNMGRYIYRAHIGGRYFTNYADAPLTAFPDGQLIYRYGKKIQDQNMIDMGIAMNDLSKSLVNNRTHGNAHHIFRTFEDLLSTAEVESQSGASFPLLKDVFIDGIQMIAARPEKGTDKGLYLSAKGGNNDESHNHNDVGSFILYSDSVPTIIDIGSGLYNAKTFSDKRYEIMQMQSFYHNLPIVNGCGQLNGVQYSTGEVFYETKDCGCTVFTEEIAPAYDPAAKLNSLKRTYVYSRSEAKVTLKDEISMYGEANTVDFVFMMPVAPQISEGRIIIAPAGARPLEMTFDPALKAEYEQIDVTNDDGLVTNWGQYLYRVKVHAEGGKEITAQFTFQQVQ